MTEAKFLSLENYNKVQLLLQIYIAILILIVSFGGLPLGWVVASIFASQALAMTEVYHAVKGTSPSNPVTSFIQVAARIGVSLVLFAFIQTGLQAWVVAVLGFAWALADAVRCLFYLNKNNHRFAWARYNFFIVLYPLGMTLENLVIWKVLQHYLESPLMVFIPFFVIYVLLAIKMYRHMLIQRRRFISRTSVSS